MGLIHLTLILTQVNAFSKIVLLIWHGQQGELLSGMFSLLCMKILANSERSGPDVGLIYPRSNPDVTNSVITYTAIFFL